MKVKAKNVKAVCRRKFNHLLEHVRDPEIKEIMKENTIITGGEAQFRIHKSAELSDCGRYRWWLRRTWSGGDGRVVCFVMLNPSTADASVDDPTIRRCIGFARDWGYSSLSVRNLFALRATKPKLLLTSVHSPTGGQRGDSALANAITAHTTVVAWGAKVPFLRDAEALKMFRGHPLWCLGTTKHGKPRHPLYVKREQPLVEFRP